MGHKFTQKERQRVFTLVEKLIGTHKVAHDGAEIFLNNIDRRMYLSKKKKLEDYLDYASQNRQEHDYLISALTIHTTYWFREENHFKIIEGMLAGYRNETLRVLSLGCSTGEEVYSLALVFEAFRIANPSFNYEIVGLDIDPISIEKAKTAIYHEKDLKNIPMKFRKMVLLGSGKSKGLMTLDKNVRERCSFKQHSALEVGSIKKSFHMGICRNMLIYFDPDQVDQIVSAFSEKIEPGGAMILGHSESFNAKIPCTRMGHSVFTINGERRVKSTEGGVVKKSALSESGELLLLDLGGEGSLELLENIQSSLSNIKVVGNLTIADDAIKNSQCKIVIMIFTHESAEEVQAWLARAKNKFTKIAFIAVANAQLGELEELSSQADEFIYLKQIMSNTDFFYRHLKKLLELKKAVSHFSHLPIAVVDDDEFVAETFCSILESEGLTAKAFSSGESFLEYFANNKVQAVVSDYRMPEMDGEELSQKVNEANRGIPFILVTGFSKGLDESQYYRLLRKPVNSDALIATVQESILSRYKGELLRLDKSRVDNLDLLVLGGSTGAPQTFQKVLSQLGTNFPPTVLVQHISPQFQKSFGDSIAECSGLRLEIVENSVELRANTLYISKPDSHIKVKNSGAVLYAYADNSAPYKGLRPCVNHLFDSAAAIKNKKILGVLMTGMGDDGAEGLGKMKDNGHYTIAQDIGTSIVFGMPKVAIDHGNVHYIGSDSDIRNILLNVKKAS